MRAAGRATEPHAKAFKLCSACMRVVYCTKEHQAADWPAHRAACKAARRSSK
jgi:hypothetical protein